MVTVLLCVEEIGHVETVHGGELSHVLERELLCNSVHVHLESVERLCAVKLDVLEKSFIIFGPGMFAAEEDDAHINFGSPFQKL